MEINKNVIAIDGPSGSGKSTIAKKIATQLGWLYLNTGAMYRALGYILAERGYSLDYEDPKLSQELLSLNFEYGNADGSLIKIDGIDLTSKINNHNVSALASKVSKLKNIRDYLKSKQRDLAGIRPSVIDGRDIGTVIFPDAFLKIYLTADPKIRAERRLKELNDQNKDHTFDEILSDITKRDREDENREIAPLKKADDAILIDASFMNIDEVVGKITNLCMEKR